MSKVRAASDVTVYVGDQVTGLNVSPQFDGYSKVILNVTKELSYEAGTDTGRTMTLTCPWGTQEMCNNILATIKGYAYQPLEATGAYLDPAAELGDGVTVRDTYTMIGSTKNTFGPMLVTDIVTPHETEINHELPYKSPINREVDRQNAGIRSELRIQADRITAEINERKQDTSELRASLQIESARITAEVSERKKDTSELRASLKIESDRITAEINTRKSEIERVNTTLTLHGNQISAKVSKTGGNSASFGWAMDESGMIWYANSSEIFRLDKNGAHVTGKITATSGSIGGFTIRSGYLSTNNQTWGGTNSSGIYIGPNGIQLGKYFKVDSSGNLSASSGSFSGTVQAGSIVSDGVNGYGGSFSGAGISSGSITNSRISNGTIQSNKTAFSSSLSYADAFGQVLNGTYTGSLYAYGLFLYNGGWKSVRKRSLSVKLESGGYAGYTFLTL